MLCACAFTAVACCLDSSGGDCCGLPLAQIEWLLLSAQIPVLVPVRTLLSRRNAYVYYHVTTYRTCRFSTAAAS